MLYVMDGCSCFVRLCRLPNKKALWRRSRFGIVMVRIRLATRFGLVGWRMRVGLLRVRSVPRNLTTMHARLLWFRVIKRLVW